MVDSLPEDTNYAEVLEKIISWHPTFLGYEAEYQDSLISHLLLDRRRRVAKNRHVIGTSVDVYIQCGNEPDLQDDVLIEMKADMRHKPEFNRAVGQVIDLLSRSARHVVLLLCGLSRIDLADRVCRALEPSVENGILSVIVKPPAYLTGNAVGSALTPQNVNRPVPLSPTTVWRLEHDRLHLLSTLLSQWRSAYAGEWILCRDLVFGLRRVAEDLQVALPDECKTVKKLASALRDQTLVRTFGIETRSVGGGFKSYTFRRSS
jgi:hypothetical protein